MQPADSLIAFASAGAAGAPSVRPHLARGIPMTPLTLLDLISGATVLSGLLAGAILAFPANLWALWVLAARVRA